MSTDSLPCVVPSRPAAALAPSPYPRLSRRGDQEDAPVTGGQAESSARSAKTTTMNPGPIPHRGRRRPSTGPIAHHDPARPLRSGLRIEVVAGTVAAGGGCVARAADGRVVFVRHALPGERVVAEVTAVTTSFLRADAVEVIDGVGRPDGASLSPRRSRSVRRLRLAAHLDPRPATIEGRPGCRAAPQGGRHPASGGGRSAGWRRRWTGLEDPGEIRRRSFGENRVVPAPVP